jgi:Rrf2 family transcriptional regulator, iron-sulfur cluster assembly transcription factor
MQITMTSEYAVRALLFLASMPAGSIHRIADVAIAAEVPDNYLRKIVPTLAKAGFVQTTSGATGGIRLAADPDVLNLLDVLLATEGDLFLNRCLISPKVCHRQPFCPVHETWFRIQQQMKQTLRDQTISLLAAENARKQEQFAATGINLDPLLAVASGRALAETQEDRT